MAEQIEKRGSTRFKIRCPVTVRVQAPGQGRAARELGQGTLCDIGEKGARFNFCGPLKLKEKICLDVHIQPDLDAPMTTLRFWGTIERVQHSFPFETAVSFVSRGKFLRSHLKRINRVPKVTMKYENGEWIN